MRRNGRFQVSYPRLSLVLYRLSDGAHLGWLFDDVAGFADEGGESLWGPVGVAGCGADADVPHEVLARVLWRACLGKLGGELRMVT